MKLREILQPFWYEPEFQDDEAEKIEFRLRPLTEADMVDVEELYIAGRPTQRAQYAAGCRAIIDVRGAYEANGDPAKSVARMPRHLVSLAGYRAIVAQEGGDWEDKVRRMRAFITGESLDDEPEEPHEDPVKN